MGRKNNKQTILSTPGRVAQNLIRTAVYTKIVQCMVLGGEHLELACAYKGHVGNIHYVLCK